MIVHWRCDLSVAPNSLTAACHFLALGLETAITYPDGEIITQTYNARGLLAQVANPSDTPDTGPG